METLSSCEQKHNLGQNRRYNFNGIAKNGVSSPDAQLERSHMNDLAKVSVVIPCFNCGATIRRAISSVVADSFPNREIIAVNDGSEDDTADQLTALASQYRGIVNVIHQDNRGANTARNRGLDEATGDYIQFLDADDFLCDDKLDRSVRVMNADDNVMCVYTDGKGHGNESVVLSAHDCNIEAIINRTLREFTFGMNTNMPLWRHEFLTATAQRWDQDLVCWHESEYYFRLLLALDSTDQIVHLEFPGYVRTTSTPGISSGVLSSGYIRGKTEAILKIHRLCHEVGLGVPALQSQVDDFMWQLYKTAVLHRADDVLPLLKANQSSRTVLQRTVHALPAAWVRGLHGLTSRFRTTHSRMQGDSV